jgi:DNA modification methylase
MLPELNKIYNGDCIEIMRGWPDESIDMIFSDPPYGHSNNNGDLIHNREKVLGLPLDDKCDPISRPIANDGPEANELARKFFREAARLLKPGSCCCCCCCCCGGPDPQFARWSLWLDEELDFKQMVIWDKGPMGMGWHYRRSYETVLVAQKTGAACKWYDETNRIENIIRPGLAPKIIPSKDQHPTEKPVELAMHFIKLHSQPGDIVLDPFAGSGSALDGANRLGRQWIGIECDEIFFKMGTERMRRAVVLPPEEAISDGRLF